MKGRPDPPRDHLETARRWANAYERAARPAWATCMRVNFLLLRDYDRVSAERDTLKAELTRYQRQHADALPSDRP